MFCPNCGKKIADNSRFCEFCGAEVWLPGMDGAADDAEPEYAEQSEIDGLDVNRPGAECENAEAGTGTGGVGPDMPEPEGSNAAAVSDNGGNDAKNRKRRMIIILIVIAAAAAAVVIVFAVMKLSDKKKQENWQEQYDLGEQALLDEDYEQAVVNFTEAIEIDPEEPDAYMGRAKAYIGTGETEENMTAAIADCETVIDLDQTYIDAYIYESDIYADSGNFESAIDILEKGKKANPEDEEIPKKIDEIEDRQEKKEAADRYQAYYDKLMELQEMYGKAKLEFFSTSSSYYWTGMFFAKLIDFDGDGFEELITGIYDEEKAEEADWYEKGYEIQVWSYQDGEVQEIWQQEPYCGGDGYVCYILGDGSVSYMADGGVSDDGRYGSFYSLEDGEFVRAKSFSIDIAEQSDDMEDILYLYFVDEEEVSYEEYSEAYEEWYSMEELQYIFAYFNSWEKDETVIDELENTLNTLCELLGIEAEEAVEETSEWASVYLDFLESEITVSDVEWLYYSETYLYKYYDDEYEYEYELGYIGFGLIYVDEDDIPELVMYGTSEDTGMLIFTIGEDSEVDVIMSERTASFYYAEYGNVLVNSAGVAGFSWDYIYTIEDGKWVNLAKGQYEYYDADEDGLLSYTWDGEDVTESEYEELLEEYADEEDCIYIGSDPEFTLDELKAYLSTQ